MSLVKSSLLFCWTYSETEICNSHLTASCVDHVSQMLICSGQGARGHGRVNALRAQHIASISLPFLFTLLAQCPAVTELKSEGRHATDVTAGKWLKTESRCFPPSVISTWFSPQSYKTGNMTWTKPHQFLNCNCRIMSVNAAVMINLN